MHGLVFCAGMPSAEQSGPLHHTWKATPYLMSRTQELHSTLTDTAPDTKPVHSHYYTLYMHVLACVYTQVMGELEVIGHTPRHLPGETQDGGLDSLGEEGSYSEDSLSGSEEAPPVDQ